MTLKFKKLNPRAILPAYAHDGDSGMDIRTTETVTLAPHHRHTFATGLACAIPYGFELQVRPRSGLAARHGVVAMFGTVDCGYRGEIGVTLVNLSDKAVDIRAGDRIAQIVVSPVCRATIAETDELDDTARGTDGFGSTGVR